MKVEPIRDNNIIQLCFEYLKETNERNVVMFAIGIYTGLRISDILTLRVNDVYKKNRIILKQKKTNEYVNVVIHSELKKIVNDYCKDKSKYEYLIKSRNGTNKPITIRQAYNVLNEMAAYLRIENVGTHTMRKTAGFTLYNSTGKDIGKVMKMLGQSDPKNTLRYIGVEQMDLDESIRKMSYKIK